MVPAITYGGWSIAVWNQGMSPRGEVLNMREIAINRIYQRPDGSWVIKPNEAERLPAACIEHSKTLSGLRGKC